MPVYCCVADALSSLPDEFQPTNLSERNVSQNFASLDFHASYALFSSIKSGSFVGAAGAVFAAVLAAAALFAGIFPAHAVRRRAAAKYLILAMNFPRKKRM